jgi:GTP cyclohydrolase IA
VLASELAKVDQIIVEEVYRELIMQAEGRALREGTEDTPRRAAAAWAELTSGYGPEPELTTFDADGYDEIVAVAAIPFYSLCEHHLLPFHGQAHIAYLPGDRILGLSKFARVVEHYARRLQTQERLTVQIADSIDAAIAPAGVGVVLVAEHLCMAMRGVQKSGAQTTTSVMRGALRDKPAARAEALALLGGDL